MSAEAQPAVATPQPDPHPAGAGVPAALGRVIRLVRKLIDYGKQLVGTMQQRAAAPGFAHFAKPFDTADLAAVLARITAGLCRAAALEARLCRRAASGRDLTPSPIRLPAPRGPRQARQAAPPDAQPEPQHADHAEHPLLARLPTEEEIAAEVRRGPSARSSSISARTSASRLAISTGLSGTKSGGPSPCMAAASWAGSRT